jgi:DNA-binding SARP family transcriptional activator
MLAPAEAALPLLRSAGDEFQLAYGLIALGAATDASGDPTRALVHLGEALSIIRRRPRHVILAFALYWYGRAALDTGDRAGARAAFDEAIRTGRELGHRPAIAHPLRMAARIAFLEDRPDAAAAQYAESALLHYQTDDRWGLANALEGMAAVAVGTGRAEAGVRLMAAAELVRERLVSALGSAERGERERHLQAARRSLGSRFDDARAAGRALRLEEVMDLVAEIPRGPSAPAPPPEEPAPPPAAVSAPAALRVLALGPLQIFRGSDPIDSTAWGSARPRELLIFLLLARGGRTKEEVGLALWPEASAAQLRNSFHVTLHRLRKALGTADWIVQSNERYQVDPALALEFDVDRFERETADAIRADSAPALERALAWYRGDFLDGEPVGDWHQAHRDRLRLLFADGAMALGLAHLRQDRAAKAAEVFRRVLVRDELREEAWRQLMICHARLGERAQATRLYQQLVTVLAQELESEPDPETAELHHRIQAGASV